MLSADQTSFSVVLACFCAYRLI